MLHPLQTCSRCAAAGVLALASVSLATGQQPRHAWTVTPDDDAIAVLEITPEPSSLNTVRFSRADEVSNRLAPREWRAVATLKRLTGAWQAIAAQRLSNGAWAIVQTELAGGTNVLQYLLVQSELRNLASPVAQSPELIDSIRLVDQKVEERPRLIDVSSPRIVEHMGQVYLIGQSYLHHSAPDEYAVWVAPAKPVEQPRVPGHVLNNGRIIGHGQQPRTVSWNGRTVVAMQIAQLNLDGAWGKTVKVYETTDLETWKTMSAPDPALEFYDYELTVAQGKLTLVGVVDISARQMRGHRGGREQYQPPLALVVLTYDPDKGGWQETSRKADSTLTTKSEVKLLPTEVTGGALKLIRRDTDGTYTISPVAD